jgi:nicotinate-nucleotide--dimethylbenzimidazole phosphoribosyltransferase
VTSLTDAMRSLTQPDAVVAATVANRAANILRPTGALARLDELAVWLAGWQRTATPSVQRPTAVIFAGDHGVVAGGVSAYPASITASMLEAFRAGVSSINVLGRAVGATVITVDVGVGRPTADFRYEPAMGNERFAEAVDAGRTAVATLDTDLLVVGEMGIGNTTAAAAVCTVLLGGEPHDWVGRGTGVDDEAMARKVEAVRMASERVQALGASVDPEEVLRQVGGTELGAIAGAVVEARRRSIAVVLDGYVTAAAVAPLAQLAPGALDHCVAGHCSAEPGHRRLLEVLGLKPLLDLGMRLGEGSGAMVAVPLVAMACRLVTEVPTFDEWLGGDDHGRAMSPGAP